MKPLVVIDADVLGRRRTGDETYVENLLRELAPIADRERLAAVTRRPELVPGGVESIELPAQSQSLRMAVTLPRLLRRLRPELSHFNYVVPPAYRGRAVVTVHDTPNGVDPLFHPNGKAREGPPYALFVGGIQPRKDPLTALEALALLDRELQLLVVGSERRGGDAFRETVRRLGLERRVELAGHVDREELATLYRGAACLVFPSRYEGFGLPLLEAMASGVPVVASNAGALPEVAGEAALLVEPGDPAALAAGVERALAERERLVAAGLEHVRRYSWAECARRTLDVYRELL